MCVCLHVLCVYGLSYIRICAWLNLGYHGDMQESKICKNQTCKLIGYAHVIIRSEVILNIFIQSRNSNNECECFGPIGLH